MSEWRKIWANGLPDEGRSPKSGHRMAAEGMPFPWRWNGGTISTDLDVIWGMSAKNSGETIMSEFDGEAFVAHDPMRKSTAIRLALGRHAQECLSVFRR